MKDYISKEQRADNRRLFKEMTAGMPVDMLPNWGNGPMFYLGDSVYVTKNGDFVCDDGGES